jgi:uncharacterized protein
LWRTPADFKYSRKIEIVISNIPPILQVRLLVAEVSLAEDCTLETMLDLSEKVVPLILERHPGVRAVYLFGSRVSGMIHAASDWDFAILGDTISQQERIDTAARLSSLLESEVDLVDLSTASTALCFQVIATGRPIRILDQISLERFEMETLTAYQNLNESRKAILRDFGMAA